MPWAGRAPVVVSFSAAALPRRPTPRPAALACKRRLEKQEPEPTRKHFLSEDKMAARFNTLSLDHDHAYGSNGFPSRWPRPLPRGPQDATLEEEEETVILDGEFPMALTTEAVLWSPPSSQDPRGIWALLQAGALTPKATAL
ncbi:host cell factor C1 regulator 1 [Alligator mississippiensis]|uniref:Host cell factor C1 regulator 1 n=2 Tax=Alligator mississippiensis TaxID=8496 RepID=A0A151NQD4_ALLMI|nr:host cell factor C1 regulator 1 [Alligator mississippiensis]